jgi:hypothetical protein
MQERVFGGLKPSVRRLLERASEDTGGHRISRTRSVTKASAGTILIRDWQGKSHHVTVLDRGVLYPKKNYLRSRKSPASSPAAGGRDLSSSV